MSMIMEMKEYVASITDMFLLVFEQWRSMSWRNELYQALATQAILNRINSLMVLDHFIEKIFHISSRYLQRNLHRGVASFISLKNSAAGHCNT